MAPSGEIAAPALQELLASPALAREWVLDPSRSTVALQTSSIWGLVRVTGAFSQVTGNATISPTGEVTGTVTVAAASIDTRNARRDEHLRSADFFDSGNHPDITFGCEGVRPSGQGVTVSGILRVRDRARPLAFDATAEVRGDGEMWLDATAHVNRADFGITWNLMGLVSVNNLVTIHAVFTGQ